jgi:hypothetical protein
MLKRALVFVLTLLIAAGTCFSQEPGARRPRHGPSPWLKAESPHFEIHCQSALGSDLDRVIRSGEAAYDKVSGRLDFVLATKVPLVVFTPSGPLTHEQVAGYAASDDVAPPQPHRSRILLPLSGDRTQLDALLVHELAHLLMYEMILPGRSGDGGLPRWIREGFAAHMVGVWTDDDTHLMQELVAASGIPALSRLTGSDGFANAHLNDVIGHAAFDCIEGRWGVGSVRRFLRALIVPRADKTYDAVFELTPAAFDAAFRQYAADRFRPAAR